MKQQSRTIDIFCCYAREDEDLLEKLKRHLSPLRRQGVIDVWYDREIRAGTEWEEEIKRHLNEAHVILLLISPDFIHSDYCYDTEMKRAMARHERKEAVVVPIIVRPVDWQETPIGNSTLGSLQALPKDAKPVTIWKNRDEAWRDVAKEIGKVTNELLRTFSISQPLPFSPFSEDNTAILHGVSSSPKSEQERHRRQLLSLVETDWMQHLHAALAEQVEMTLRLQQWPDAVANPWLTVVQERATFGADAFLTDDHLLDVYDKALGQLLVLGEAGSGKTTLLLKLLRDLLARASQDELHPIPVVFLLSSWSIHQPALEEWLVQELHIMYGRETPMARQWVAGHAILPLLDGLDEVEESARAACVEAINVYQDAHSMNPLVVCCRSADYEYLIRQSQQKLRLRQAVCLQSLTPQQIDGALTNKDAELDAVLTAMHRDPDLQELAICPFILGLLLKIARNARLNAVLSSGSLEARRQHLFASYIESTLYRRKQVTQYLPDQTLSWLAWLAQRLTTSHQSVFYLDRIQFDWLPQEQARRLSLILVLLFRLLISVGAAVEGVRRFGVVGGLAFGLIGFLLTRPTLVKGEIEPAEKVIWSWAQVKQYLAGSLFSGVTIGALLVAGIMLLSVVSILLFFAFPTLTIFGLDVPLSSLLTDGIIVALGSTLLLIIESGWTSERLDEQYPLRRPDDGIRRSGRRGLIAGLIFGGVSCLMFSFFFSNVIDGVLCGWIVGLWFGLFNGGMAWIKHFLLRWLLWRDGSIPWDYSAFLNYAAERMLLRKVGRGYQFFHPLFLNHFVTLDLSVLIHQEAEQEAADALGFS